MYIGYLNNELILGYATNKVGERPTLYFKDYIHDLFSSGVILSKDELIFDVKTEDDFDKLSESEQKYASLGLNRLKIFIQLEKDDPDKRSLFRLYNVIKK